MRCLWVGGVVQARGEVEGLPVRFGRGGVRGTFPCVFFHGWGRGVLYLFFFFFLLFLFFFFFLGGKSLPFFRACYCIFLLQNKGVISF